MVVLRFMRFVLIIIAFLVTFFPIYINVSAFALTEEELLQKTQRLEQAMDAVVEDPGNPKLLYEKAKVMLEAQRKSSSFFSSLKGMRHTISGVWEHGDVAICEGKVTYTHHNDHELTFPFMNKFCMKDGLIVDYSIYVDASSFYAESG